MKPKLIMIFLLLALVGIFAVQNGKIVEIQFLFWTTTIPRSLLIFSMLMIGFIIGWFGHVIWRKRKTTQ